MTSAKIYKALNRTLMIGTAALLLETGVHAADFGADPQADARALLAVPVRTVATPSTSAVPDAQEQARRLLAHKAPAATRGVRTAGGQASQLTARSMILGHQA
jgi:hypothetical protein